jgi:ATP-dependent RNA helicase RhlE
VDTDITFASLGLAEPLLRAVTDAGYTHPTPIQAQAIPRVMGGGDLLAAAQTGTGKTAGFTLPILHYLLQHPTTVRRPGRPRVLVLTPTRELTAQVEESVRLYSKYTKVQSMVMFGGVNINPQIAALKRSPDILVATPGRLLDHVGQKTLDLSGIEILVLDEADRMLDMGFIHDIKRVLRLLPKERQTLLFSATFADEIRDLAQHMLNHPEEVSVARRNTASELVSQRVVMTEQAHKRDLLSHIIRNSGWNQVLVFTRTKHGANRLAEKLSKDGLTAAAIHGNKSQAARTRALAGFKDGQIAVLVATDIAARGLDIEQLPQVVNFELPNVPEDYVHRIGRTGRAGSTGSALSLVDGSEIKLLKAIERLIKQPIERKEVEGWNPRAMVTADSVPDAREKRALARLHDDSRSAGRAPGRRDGSSANREGRRDGAPAGRSARHASPSGDRRNTQEPRRGTSRPAGARPSRPNGSAPAARRDVRTSGTDRPAALLHKAD